jgi:TM2 domain-containing membrane protein YozV
MRITSILVLLCASLFAFPAAAQSATPGPGYKDPNTATLVGLFLPGAGQMYTGETKRGAAIMGVGLGSLVLGTVLASNTAADCYDDDFDCNTGGIGASVLLGYLGYVAAWGYGIFDASDSAARMNARNGVSVAGVRLEPIAAPSPDGTRVGLSLRF